MCAKQIHLILLVVVLSLALTSYGSDLVSDFENQMDGWVIRQSGIQVAFSTNGATLNNYSLKVSNVVAWQQAIQLPMNQEPLKSILQANNHFSFDVTWINADWPQGGTWAKVDAVIINGQAIGWNQLNSSNAEICTDSANSGFPGGWDPSWGEVHTRTMTYDYSRVNLTKLPAAPTYLELILALHSGDFASGTFYIDNFVFFDGANAYNPVPRNTASDIPIDTNLSWSFGEETVEYDVYFGTDFDEVNNASYLNLGDPADNSVYRAYVKNPGEGIYDIPETLAVGTTYYWRIDLNSVKNEVWSFTTQGGAKEPSPANLATEISPESLVLSWRPGFPGAIHDVYFGASLDEVSNATRSDPMGPDQVYRAHLPVDANSYAIQQSLDISTTYYWRIDALQGDTVYPGEVWAFTTFSAIAKDPTPEDGASDVSMRPVLSWVPGNYTANQQHVYWGTDSNGVATAKATDHPNVEFAVNVGPNTFDPGILLANTTYYWRVDEVNNLYPDGLWEGDIWSFTTGNYITVDDFEDYKNTDVRGDNRIFETWHDGLGFTNPDNSVTPGNGTGMSVGVATAPYGPEMTIIHGGSQQSLPLTYDNTEEPYYSETDRTFASPQDWSAGGARSLSLWFYGDPTNAAGANNQMYVKLNGSKVMYDLAKMDDLKEASWHEWHIDLADFGIDLTNVTEMVIGFGENNQTAGGSGTVYVDDIRLYIPRHVLSERTDDFARVDVAPAGFPYNGDCQVDYLDLQMLAREWLAEDEIITTSNPGTSSLLVYYPFDEGSGSTIADASGEGHNGSLGDGVTWTVPGVLGNGALQVSGEPGARVTIDSMNPAAGTGQLTLSIWVKWTGIRRGGSQGLISKRDAWDLDSLMFMFEVDSGGNANGIALRQYSSSDTDVMSGPDAMTPYIGRWVHAAATFDGTTGRIYLDGREIASGPFSFAHGTTADITIGNTNSSAWEDSPEVFNGYLDEARIYNRALSAAQIAYLADTTPEDGQLYIPASTVDLYIQEPEGSRVMNLFDLAVLGQYWMEEQLWP